MYEAWQLLHEMNRSGSGYLSVCMARMLRGNGGKVYGVDTIPDLVEQSLQNVRKEDGDLLESGLLRLQHGDGWIGLPNEGPFDVIHVGAAASEPPRALMEQVGILQPHIGAVFNISNMPCVVEAGRSLDCSSGASVWEPKFARD